MPVFVARRVRLHALATAAPSGVDPPADPAPLRDGLDVDELLTAWIANAQGVHEPDTLDGCADYARYLEERDRAEHDAGELCRRLRETLALWIATRRGPRADA